MNLYIHKEDDPILGIPSTNWDFEIDGDPTELVKEMSKLMLLHGGIGLAAPQCGVSKRIFVMGNSDHLVACINPVILSVSGIRERDVEGCLSFPDLWMYVEREVQIEVEYYNAGGEKVVQELGGLMARVFQHENDHLHGICFDSRVGKFALDRAKEKRKKIRARKDV